MYLKGFIKGCFCRVSDKRLVIVIALEKGGGSLPIGMKSVSFAAGSSKHNNTEI